MWGQVLNRVDKKTFLVVELVVIRPVVKKSGQEAQ